ncbi:hypothetical protein AC625_06710 [Peribacillus loiseleuriae]|uniref:Histidine kinase n=1 Tax=Peribacillus loiseleuriae TaxID=1679170 RepID=A0A0K9GRG8_9BACI|nr:hypothetical protein AC625_06710 [Peribacillus loiseleuriae]
MKALNILFYSLTVGILLFLTIAILPELEFIKSLKFNVSKWIWMIIATIFILIVKEKMWIKVVSLILGLVFYMLIIILFVS